MSEHTAGGLTSPLICPIVVGRAPHLAAFRQVIDRTLGNTGQFVLIAGEAGMGKTRLVAEVIAEAATRGFLILQGACFQTDAASPYAPLLDLLRTHFADRPPDRVVADLGPAARELAPLLPDLLPVLPHPPLPPAPDPAAAKRRLVAALTQFVIRLTRDQPVLLVMEDCHWADDASLDFLHHLARAGGHRQLLLVVTFRTDEIHPGLRRWLAQLDHDRLTAELTVSGLTHAEVDAMLRAIFALDRPVWADFLDAIIALTEGNPFFIEEVLAALVAAGDLNPADADWDRWPLATVRVPRSIQDAVLRRAEQLSDATRDLLRLAAVAGRRFDIALLGALTGADAPRLLASLKEVLAAGLVVEETADRFAFRHALTRQAIYAELLGHERRALHQAVADALDRSVSASGPSPVADLAYHCAQAGVWERALTAALQAGQQALDLYAPRAAAQHFTLALDAAAHLGWPAPLAAVRGRAQAREWVGDFAGSRRDGEAALAAPSAAGDRPTEWRALIDLGLLWTGRDHEQSRSCFERALGLARDLDQPALLAQSLNRLGNWFANADRPGDGLVYHQEALTIFQRLDDQAGLASTLDLIGTAHAIDGDLALGAAAQRQAIGLFSTMDDRRGLASSLAILAACGHSATTDTVMAVLVPAEAERVGREALRLARDIGWRAGEAYALVRLAGCLRTQGDYGQALQLAQAALAVAEEIEHQRWMGSAQTVIGILFLDLLTPARAQPHLEAALTLAAAVGGIYQHRSAAGRLASAAIATGDLTRASILLDSVLKPDTPARTLGQRQCWYARAELALAREEPDRALMIADRLLTETPNTGGPAAPGIPRLTLLRGTALAALGRSADAEVALLAARAGAMSQGLRYQYWPIELALGQLYRGWGRPTDADQAFASAGSAIEDLAATVTDPGLRAAFRQQAQQRLPRSRPPSPRRAAKAAFGGLTEREREVAALVAQGLTNGEIAAALVIEKRTVETHVGNILAKLGLASRAYLIAWSLDHGLGRTTGQPSQPAGADSES